MAGLDGASRVSKDAILVAKLAMLSDICLKRLNISGGTGSVLFSLLGLGVVDMINTRQTRKCIRLVKTENSLQVFHSCLHSSLVVNV